jgi:KUP system potassium uptake protein
MSEHGENGKSGAQAARAALALGALGIVYGDIGTSPLYAMRESFEGHGIAVMRENVLGVLSLIFWSLMIVISIKYVVFVMRADNNGEGGILALTSLIKPDGGNGARRSQAARWLLILVGLFGTALLYGDGMITPAISVLSAVEGIDVATPALHSYVVPVAIVILIALFAIQRRGTGTIGAMFGPIMVAWFATLAGLGLIHLFGEPGVLLAINPIHAITYFENNGIDGFLSLGSIFLVVTGSEALYADMGHFGKRPIQTSWFAIVLPALTLHYFGQGALLIGDPAAIDNPFYRMAPDWALWPLLILATIATVIASQALISGAFSLTMQAVQLGYLPRTRILHTSETESGQVYIPTVNWVLMLACVGLVAGFRSSSGLAAAYGVAVAMTMVITTVLFFTVTRDRWHWTPARAGVTAGLILIVDLGYFGANLFKIPHGGWFPIVIGLIIFALMTTWKRGRELLAYHLNLGQLPLDRFVENIAQTDPPRVRGEAVYMSSLGGSTPPALLANFRHNETLHADIVILTVRTESIPRVPRARRATVEPLGAGFSQVTLSYGYMEEPDVPEALRNIVAKGFGIDPDRASYVLGRETVLATEVPGMAIWREKLFAVMARNASNAARYFRLPPQQCLEIGLQVEI